MTVQQKPPRHPRDDAAQHYLRQLSRCAGEEAATTAQQKPLRHPRDDAAPSTMEPLTATTLAAAPPHQQKQMLGECIYRFVMRVYPGLASKITGMLLEINNSELLYLLGHDKSLRAKVEEAVAVLKAGGPLRHWAEKEAKSRERRAQDERRLAEQRRTEAAARRAQEEAAR